MSSVTIQNRTISGMDYTRMVHNNNLRGEIFRFLWGIIMYCIVFVFKIYLETVTIQQLQLIFDGPCYYNKNIKFTNVKPTYWSASRYGRYLLQFFSTHITI